MIHCVNTFGIKRRKKLPSKKPQILIRTNEENKKKLEYIANQEKRSVSNLMEIIIENFLKKYETENREIKPENDNKENKSNRRRTAKKSTTQ